MEGAAVDSGEQLLEEIPKHPIIISRHRCSIPSLTLPSPSAALISPSSTQLSHPIHTHLQVQLLVQLVQLLDLELGGVLYLKLGGVLLLLRLGREGQPHRRPMGQRGDARLPAHGDHHDMLPVRAALQLLLLPGANSALLLLLQERDEKDGRVRKGWGEAEAKQMQRSAAMFTTVFLGS